MSKLESISRYSLLVNRLQKRPSTFNEISEYLERESEFQERDFSISKRTFQRDVKEIFELFRIEITFNRSSKKYELIDNEQATKINRLLETFDLFNALNLSERLKDLIQFEKRKPKGTEHIQNIIKTIKKRKQIQFNYQKFWEAKSTLRTAEPYLIKEFRNRWYLVAKDLKDNSLKTFGLDRLTNPILTNQTFEYPKKEILDNKFKNCFGVITPDKEISQKIVLSFTAFQAKYIKTLPLHETQEIISENPERCVFSINIHPTDDFIFELLSYGDSVKVLEPESLIKTIKRKHQKALAQYE